MRTQEISISWPHRFAALLLALLAGSITLQFILVLQDAVLMASGHPAKIPISKIFSQAVFEFTDSLGLVFFWAALDFIPAFAIGFRMLQKRRLLLQDFLMGAFFAAIIPAVLILMIPVLGPIMVSVAMPGIICGSLIGGLSAWFYLRTVGAIPPAPSIP